MIVDRLRTRAHRIAAALLLASSIPAAPALAQNAPAAAGHAPVDGEKILQLLVAKGVISQAEADGIIGQAAASPAPPVVAGGIQGDTQTVPYVPQVVRDQIKQQIETEMAARAQSEGWARPGEVAEWTKRIRLYGDIRVRGEGILFPKTELGAPDPVTHLPVVLAGNAPDIPNFNAINTGAPFDINPKTNHVPGPVLNTIHDRERPRIRARLGLDASLTNSITAQLRIATGNDTSPVSTNQTLGGGNGDFSKYAIWLDRANIQFAPHGRLEGARLVAGRAANPFWTSELIFDDDLNFDGVSLATKTPPGKPLSLFSAVGAFPTYNTDLNFGSKYSGGFKSHDRWLIATQVGAAYTLASSARLTAALGYFDFANVQGKISSPCLYDADTCDTDNTRPLFAQYGNTYYPIRHVIGYGTEQPGIVPEPQYFGLASQFRVLEAHAALDFNPNGRIPVRIEGEFIRNLAFDRAWLKSVQTNVIGDYDPSGTGWTAGVQVGTPNPRNWGEWKLFGSYRRIGSDATVDGFTDSDFHLGGTNAKGYILGGSLGIGGGAAFGARWLSADQITGQPYGVDVLQVDLTAGF